MSFCGVRIFHRVPVVFVQSHGHVTDFDTEACRSGCWVPRFSVFGERVCLPLGNFKAFPEP